ncbi:GPI-anchored protein LLG3 [Linum grandiflorum]
MLSPAATVTKPFSQLKHLIQPSFHFSTTLIAFMDSPPRTFSSSSACSAAGKSDGGDSSITLQEWRGWGAVSPIPSKVLEVIDDLKLLESNIDAQMKFGGSGGKLKGDFRTHEEKKHRAKYEALDGPENKIQFFSARQIACRLLGSRGYLCQKCWLPLEEDCMCSQLKPCALWPGIRFWIYMHPKDFLRQNNTGKLLWQVFGAHSATLCLYGISEDEEIMWNAFKAAGKNKVWCLYPNKNAATKSVFEAFGQESIANQEMVPDPSNADKALNFLLIDGTWNNSAAMFRRLKEKSKSTWGDEDLPCISLATGVSTMHTLRPQPSWDRTCTAAAAAGLLFELQELAGFSCIGLEKQGEALENNLAALLEALTTRRLRMAEALAANNMTHHPGREMLQDGRRHARSKKRVELPKKPCKLDFEKVSYMPLFKTCEPPFPVRHCCDGFKQLACRYTSAINDDTTTCAGDMFYFINQYYPRGWFDAHCKEGPRGLDCTVL